MFSHLALLTIGSGLNLNWERSFSLLDNGFSRALYAQLRPHGLSSAKKFHSSGKKNYKKNRMSRRIYCIPPKGLCHYKVEPLPVLHSSSSRFSVCAVLCLSPWRTCSAILDYRRATSINISEQFSDLLRCLLSIYFNSPAFFIAFFKSASDILPDAQAVTWQRVVSAPYVVASAISHASHLEPSVEG